MDAKQIKKLSKALSYVLRHNPSSIGITLDSAGWTDVDSLCKAMTSLTREILSEIVSKNDKQRFEFDADQRLIRARQGHSVSVDLGYEPLNPPAILFHGTARHNLDSIFEKGLLKGNRHHVHMSLDKETMIAVGARYGKPVVLQIDAQQMHADGFVFFRTNNSVWLTEHVPPCYLTALY